MMLLFFKYFTIRIWNVKTHAEFGIFYKIFLFVENGGQIDKYIINLIYIFLLFLINRATTRR